MKNTKTYIMAFALAFATDIFGQNPIENESKPYIEVTGYSVQEVIPDEIYINIIIREKYENKEKVTIESQEENLKRQLKEIGINLDDLYLSNADADYVKINWRTKDVITKKDYTLKVNSALTVSKVFHQLDKLAISDAYISNVYHTKLDSLKKESKIAAIKNAKDKADYMLTAIGEQTGKPLIVKEQYNEKAQLQLSGISVRGSRSDSNGTYIDGMMVYGNKETEKAIQFKKIKIESSVYLKFGIK